MSFWNWMNDSFPFPHHTSQLHESPVINPCTGLPMAGNSTAGFDIGGSPYGEDVHQIEMWQGMDCGHHSFDPM